MATNGNYKLKNGNKSPHEIGTARMFGKESIGRPECPLTNCDSYGEWFGCYWKTSILGCDNYKKHMHGRDFIDDNEDSGLFRQVMD